MNKQILQITLLCLLFLGLATWRANAQDEDCPAQVYYGDGGTDAGQCLDHEEGLCETKEYAVHQGRSICSSKIQVFNVLRKVETIYTPVTERTLVDWLIVIAYWLLPTVGGSLVGIALERWVTKLWPKKLRATEA